MNDQPPVWRLSPTRVVALDRPRVLGILNLTPDSFSDGGAYAGVNDAVRAAGLMLETGADGIDAGGESTRPGAMPVSAAEQIKRTAPVIGVMRRSLGDGFAITIDTTLVAVARAAIDAGADAINDVSAGTDDPGMLEFVAGARRGIVLMHRLRPPPMDRYSTEYRNPPDYSGAGGVVAAVRSFLEERTVAAVRAGVARECIVIDPGLGFGKSVQDNLRLIVGTRELCTLGFPVLSGLSRKSFVAKAAGLPPETPARERGAASVALSLSHLAAGASIFRVHDVREHIEAFSGPRARIA